MTRKMMLSTRVKSVVMIVTTTERNSSTVMTMTDLLLLRRRYRHIVRTPELAIGSLVERKPCRQRAHDKRLRPKAPLEGSEAYSKQEIITL